MFRKLLLHVTLQQKVICEKMDSRSNCYFQICNDDGDNDGVPPARKTV